MNLDVRLPIGLLFAMIGGVLILHGLSADPSDLKIAVLGLNIDLVWGAVMSAVGLILLGLVALADKRRN